MPVASTVDSKAAMKNSQYPPDKHSVYQLEPPPISQLVGFWRLPTVDGLQRRGLMTRNLWSCQVGEKRVKIALVFGVSLP